MTNGIIFPLDVLQYTKMIANTILETTQLSIFQNYASDLVRAFPEGLEGWAPRPQCSYEDLGSWL